MIPLPTESQLDALAAAEALGYGDRGRLRIGLAAALAKSRREEEIFGVLFDRYFDHSAGDFATAGTLADDDGPDSSTPPAATAPSARASRCAPGC